MQTKPKEIDSVSNQTQIIKSNWLSKFNKIPYKILVEDNRFTKQLYKYFPRHRFAPLLYELYIATKTFGIISKVSV